MTEFPSRERTCERHKGEGKERNNFCKERKNVGERESDRKREREEGRRGGEVEIEREKKGAIS